MCVTRPQWVKNIRMVATNIFSPPFLESLSRSWQHHGECKYTVYQTNTIHHTEPFTVSVLYDYEHVSNILCTKQTQYITLNHLQWVFSMITNMSQIYCVPNKHNTSHWTIYSECSLWLRTCLGMTPKCPPKCSLNGPPADTISYDRCLHHLFALS